MDKQRILIVEDDLFLRDLYTDILSEEGYIVDTADDGEAGLKKMRTGGYNLVLLDIIMPKMDGLSVMKQLQINPSETPNKCIVFLTNLDKNDEIKTALQLGNGYLIKSQVTPGTLIDEVKAYLDKYK